MSHTHLWHHDWLSRFFTEGINSRWKSWEFCELSVLLPTQLLPKVWNRKCFMATTNKKKRNFWKCIIKKTSGKIHQLYKYSTRWKKHQSIDCLCCTHSCRGSVFQHNYLKLKLQLLVLGEQTLFRIRRSSQMFSWWLCIFHQRQNMTSLQNKHLAAFLSCEEEILSTKLTDCLPQRHISIATEINNMLDQLYSNGWGVLERSSHPHLGF